MEKKIKIGLIVLIIGIAIVSGWWIWNTQITQVNCSNIISMRGIEKCLGHKIKAIGILECEKFNTPQKAGVHYLKFNNGTELRFLEEYPNCKDYDGKMVEVVGKFYQCGELDQCAGVGLTNIESVNLVE